MENRCLKYVGPEKCHSREDEVQNAKPITTSLSLEGGKLKITETDGVEDRDIEGSLQVLNALRRHGVAYALDQTSPARISEGFTASDSACRQACLRKDVRSGRGHPR